MCFQNIELFKLKEEINNLNNIYAHLKEVDGEIVHRETLKEHMELSMYYFKKICKEKNLESVFLNFEKSFLKGYSKESITLWRELIYNIIYTHDLGKSNPNFQVKKMKNNYFNLSKSTNSNHSLISACIYYNYYFNKVFKIKGGERDSLLLFLIINSFIISKHHGYLGEIHDFTEKLQEELHKEDKEEFINYKNNFEMSKKLRQISEAFNKIVNVIESKEQWKCIDIYVYTRFIYGLLVSSDFYATSHYQNNKEVKDLGVITDINKYYEPFKNTEVCESIEKYRNFKKNISDNPFDEGDINKLRTEMFLESERNLLNNVDEDIFFLEAPTGSGKTNTSINLAFKILENNKNINKIFYVFPFNTLVEQTKDSLFKVFHKFKNIKNEIGVINSITPIKTYSMENEEGDSKSKEYKDYEKSLLSRQFLHYPISLSTHVNLFNSLFGIDRESVFPLAHMANGVLILDEIQSYKNCIWKEIIIFLKAYARLLNMKIIIMSATLPNLSKLSYDKKGFCKLIENRDKYFNNKLFKDRVKLDFSLFQHEKDEIKAVLLNKIQAVSLELEENKNLDGKILVEFISKKSAVNFYNELKSRLEEINKNKQVLLITGDDNKLERKRIIDKAKREKNIILVATQVIEAGVDIDMDIGFKDISILDGDEQFLGRINRSCKKTDCTVYFFNMDVASRIYRNDKRNMKKLTLINEDIQEILRNKDFDYFYLKVMSILEESKNEFNDDNLDKFREEKICKLSFQDIQKRMKLIDEDNNSYTIFLNTCIEDENGNYIYGEDIWNEYYKLLIDKNMAYAERRVRLSEVGEKMDYFTYEVNKINFTYNSILGNMIYIDNGEKYFENGKFNRELLNQASEYEMI